jgi:hypothetical protein
VESKKFNGFRQPCCSGVSFAHQHLGQDYRRHHPSRARPLLGSTYLDITEIKKQSGKTISLKELDKLIGLEGRTIRLRRKQISRLDTHTTKKQ